MSVLIVYTKENDYLAKWLAQELRAHRVEVMPLRPIEPRARFISRMRRARAAIFIWTAGMAKNQNMNEAKIGAELQGKYIAFDFDVALGDKAPYAKPNASVNLLFERLRALGAAPVPVLPLDFISASQLLLAALAFFFIYLSLTAWEGNGRSAAAGGDGGASTHEPYVPVRCEAVEDDCPAPCRRAMAYDSCAD
jgi:hypothetical protein